jgi:hypothetical protein
MNADLGLDSEIGLFPILLKPGESYEPSLPKPRQGPGMQYGPRDRRGVKCELDWSEE